MARVHGEQRHQADQPGPRTRPQHQAGQPRCCPSSSGNTTATMPAASRTVPSRSGRSEFGTRVSGTSVTDSSRMAAATGTLTRKISRQPVPNRSAEVKSTPATRPSEASAAAHHHRAVQGECLAALLAREDHPERRQHLRRDDGGGSTLDDPEGDQQHRGLGQRAGQAGGTERPRAEQEEPAPAVPVAELPGGDQRRGEGEQVRRDDPGHLVAAGVQVAGWSGGRRSGRSLEQVHQGCGRGRRRRPANDAGGVGRWRTSGVPPQRYDRFGTTSV